MRNIPRARCTLDFGNSKTEHFWLCGQFGLEIDPLYKNFKTESNNEKIFFVADKHPMQTKKSETAQKNNLMQHRINTKRNNSF